MKHQNILVIAINFAITEPMDLKKVSAIKIKTKRHLFLSK